jgi:periplasmic protein TonB
MNDEPAPQIARSLDALAYALVVGAARCAAPALAERLEEEWLADLAGRTGSLSRLRLALGCCWATRSINQELSALGASAPAATAAPSTPASSAVPWWHAWPHRSAALLILIAAHLGILYALASAFVQRTPPRPQTTTANIVRQRYPTEALPPIDDPRLWNPSISDPEPPVVIESLPPLDAGPPVIPAQVGPADETAPPPVLVNRVPGGPGAGFPASDAFYPAAARRLGEEGAVMLNVCVDAAGRLTAIPAVAGPSGSGRLDAGAVRLAQAGSGHYRPTTENGRAVASCYPLRVRFELKN